MKLAVTQDAFAAALVDPSRPMPHGVTCVRGEADAKRFAVYRNNVFVGLTRALANRFPVVEKLVGSEFFSRMARAYIRRSRPSSAVILDYGDSFPAFIADFEPAAAVPYLAPVAQLEMACTRAYHAADVEPLDISVLARLDAPDLATVRLAPHPAAAIVLSDFPVGSIWHAHQTEPVVPVKARGGECVLIARPRLEVEVNILPARDAVFAEMLFREAPLAEAAERAVASDPTFDFGVALTGLVQLGAFLPIAGAEGVSANG